jgi:hypothetical protein
MAYINRATQEINLKIACFVPAGELGAWRSFYEAIDADARGELRDTPLPTGRLVVYDFAPKLGAIQGYAVRLHVFAGSATGEEDLRLVGKGADTAIVVDGDPESLVAAGHLGAELPVHRGESTDAPGSLLKAATRSALLELKKPPDESATARAEQRQPSSQHERWLDVGPYRFLVPSFFPEARCVDEPPVHRLEGVFANQVSLTLAVVLGRGTPEDAQRLVESASPAWGGVQEAATLRIEGITFEGKQGRDCSGFDPPARAVESYAGICGPDLVVFTIVYGGDGQTDESLRQLFVSMIGAALVRRMNDAPELF